MRQSSAREPGADAARRRRHVWPPPVTDTTHDIKRDAPDCLVNCPSALFPCSQQTHNYYSFDYLLINI